jgi:tellurite resistance protein TerC
MIWGIFVLFILFLLLLDLGVFHKGNHVMTTKEATMWTFVWVGLSMVFNAFIYFGYQYHWLGLGESIGENVSGKEAALNFFTGYLLEKSLSVDNIFVIALIFTYFKIEPKYQHRILFWGIIGALVFRSLMIIAGIELIHMFEWTILLLAAILIYSGYSMIFSKEEDEDIGDSFIVKLLNKLVSVNMDAPQKFLFYRKKGILFITASFLALMVIELTDLFFALDSIPAIISITEDEFIVFTSNIMAILGLRSLYFVLASSLMNFKYLKTSLSVILLFVGLKMIIHYFHHGGYIDFDIPTLYSLGFIVLCLAAGIFFSIQHSKKQEQEIPNLKS